MNEVADGVAEERPVRPCAEDDIRGKTCSPQSTEWLVKGVGSQMELRDSEAQPG